MSSKGWIKVHRKIKNNPIWQDPHYLKLWMYCLVEASHKEREQFVGNDIVKILPGQFITGRISLAEDLNNGMQPKKRQSESTWWRHLNKLKEWKMLDIKTNNKYSVVTIANWEVYQDDEKEVTSKRTTDEQQMNSKRTADEQQMNTNKNVKNLRIKELKKDLKDSTTTAAENDAIVFYQNNIGMLRPQLTEDILDFINDFGDEIVIEALTRSIDRNKPSWGYAKSILNSWRNKNIKTMEQIQAEDTEFKSRQQARYANNIVNRKAEVVPEWFEKNKQEKKQENTEVKPVDQARILELKKQMQQYS